MNKKTLFLTVLIIIIVFISSYFYLKSDKEKGNVTNSYIVTYDYRNQEENFKKIKSELNRLGIIMIKKYYKGVFPVIEIKTTENMVNDVRDIKEVMAIEKEKVLVTKIPEDI
ncbi:hypothetical protein ACWKTZ_25730 [Bacillus cereus]|uniref:hypothetical protein n=1 Tax=Bacillus cereus TaxID=1396 RepID=UPI003078F4C7